MLVSEPRVILDKGHIKISVMVILHFTYG